MQGQQITDSLLLYYPFSSNMNDASGNGFDATGTATLTTDRNNNANSAYNFIGTQKIDLPYSDTLQPQLPVSLSFWVRITMPGAIEPVFDNDNIQNNYHGIWGTIIAGQAIFGYGAGTGNTNATNQRVVISSVTTIDDGNWHHVVGIIRGPTDMEIWIDCNQDTAATYGGNGGALAYSDSAGVIGAHDSNIAGPSEFMYGDIDDLFFWKRSITPTEIDSLCNLIVIGTAEIAKENPLFIYPNPTEGKFRVESLELGVEKVEVYDVFGRLVLSSTESEIDMRGYASGMYYVKAGEVVRKLIIE